MDGKFPNDVKNEAKQIIEILIRALPKTVDGKEAILELKQNDYNWRQMEWIGWYFEYKLFTLLTEKMQGSNGPVFGKTTFDYKNQFVWDFKAHPSLTAKGTTNDPMILNDREAIETCIRENRGLGFIVIYGKAIYDTTGAFKEWHDDLKGGPSSYEQERIRRNAPSRKRKSAFEIDRIEAVFFNSQSELDRGVQEKWITFFQEGMRNADGSPRRAKYALWTMKAPDSIHPVTPVNFP